MKTYKLLAAALIAALCSGASAATLDEIEKGVTDAMAKVKSLSAKMDGEQSIEMPQMKQQTRSVTTIEMVRKGDKMLYRTDMKMKTEQEVAGNKDTSEGAIQSINDGEFMYVYSEYMSGPQKGLKNAMKMKSQGNPFDVKEAFKQLRKEDVKVLPDAKVDGQDCWVLEMKVKNAQAGMPLVRQVYYYRKDIGMAVKIEGFDSADKRVLSSVTSDIKVDATIPDDRFVFKAPEGVTVMDMSAMQSSAPKSEQPNVENIEKPKRAPKDE